MVNRDALLTPTVARPLERSRLAAISATARAKLAAALDDLDAQQRDWLQRTPLDRAVAAASGFRPFTDHDVPQPPSFNRIEDEVAAAGGDAWKLTYSRLLLLALIASLPAQTLALRIPVVVWDQVEKDLESFVEEIPGLGAARWSAEEFLKDLAVAQLRMLPNDGVGLIAVRLHPWYLISNARWHERLAVGRCLGLATCRPGLYLTYHAWRGLKEGRARPPWHRLPSPAALMAANPRLVAFFSAAWLNDPAIATISPHLQEPGKLYRSLGGCRFRMGSNPGVVQMATETSKTRRRLYEEGKYLPTTYGIFLARKALLRWAETARLDDDSEE